MTSRRLGTLLAACALALAPGTGACAPEKGAGGPRPNVVLIVWDTCRADRLSAYGHGKHTTPRLERLAAEGVRFSRAFTPAPWTAPAHASLFTGLAMHRHGLEVGRGDRMHFGIPTLAETLAAAGYDTAGFTANGFISETTGLSAGFRHFRKVYQSESGANDAEAVRGTVARWLETRRAAGGGSAPLFLFLNFMDCHQPLTPPPIDVQAMRDPAVPTEDMATAAGVIQPDFLAHLMGVRLLPPGTLRGLRVRYDAAVLHLDRKTGEILDLLRREGILDGALVAVTSDHGENLGEHGLVDHRLSLHETLLHVPLVVRWPGVFEGGRVSGAAVSLMDLYPTILEAARVAVPKGNGLDALPLPRDPGAAGRPLLAEFARPLSHIEEMRRNFPSAPDSMFERLSFSIASTRDPPDRPRPLKYIRWFRGTEQGPEEVTVREELYDWMADPGETRDLLAAGDPGARAEADRLAEAILRLREQRLR